jgi:nucleoside-diphosphate-sugar epimerase
VVDDQPATWEQLFTAMAAAVAAPPPRRLPRWMTRLVAPYAARVAVDTSMRVSNAKAKNELAWQPRFTTYREGIAAMVSDLCREDPNLPRVPADTLRARM